MNLLQTIEKLRAAELQHTLACFHWGINAQVDAIIEKQRIKRLLIDQLSTDINQHREE